MRTTLLALLLTVGSLTLHGQAPDCQFTQTFTATGYGVTTSNQAVSNVGTQCVTWRLSYYADNMTALSIQVEGAPDSLGAPGTFAAVPTTACSTTVQPPCTLDGTNPLTDPNHGTVAFRGYYAWMALHVTTFTPSGSTPNTITARMYGYKGTSPAASIRGGSGGSGVAACGTTPPTTGTAGQTCYDTAGLLWVCHPLGACTVAANWVSAVPYTGAVANVALGTHGITGAPFTGDSGTGGTTGLVPAPAAGDAAAGKYLAAGGGYGVPPGTGGAANYQTVDNAGTPLTQRPTLNFAGTGVSCADNSVATRTDCTITGGSSGIGSTVFSSVTTAGPNNSAAETSVIGTVTGSKTIAANTFGDGTVLQAHAQGYFSIPAISDSLTLKMKCGATVIGSAVLTPGAGANTNGAWRFWLDIAARGTGAGGAFITNGLVELSGTLLIDNTAEVVNTSTVAFDFTTPCVFDVTAQWGAAQVGESLKGTNVAAWFPGGASGNFVPYTGATGDVTLGAHGITGAPFTGDSGSGGTTGLVPAPAAGDAAAGKYLAAGGGYSVPAGAGGGMFPYGVVPSTGWNWDNQNSASETVASNGARAIFQTNNPSFLNIRYRALVNTSGYTVTLGSSCSRDNFNYSHDLRCFAALGDDSGKWWVFYFSVGYNGINGAVGLDQWTNSTTFDNTLFNYDSNDQETLAYAPNVLFVRFTDAGGNLTISWSRDNVGFITIYTASRTAFFTSGATRTGWGAQVNSGGTAGVSSDLLSYQETNP